MKESIPVCFHNAFSNSPIQNLSICNQRVHTQKKGKGFPHKVLGRKENAEVEKILSRATKDKKVTEEGGKKKSSIFPPHYFPFEKSFSFSFSLCQNFPESFFHGYSHSMQAGKRAQEIGLLDYVRVRTLYNLKVQSTEENT